jgi:hypothetical protein
MNFDATASVVVLEWAIIDGIWCVELVCAGYDGLGPNGGDGSMRRLTRVMVMMGWGGCGRLTQLEKRKCARDVKYMLGAKGMKQGYVISNTCGQKMNSKSKKGLWVKLFRKKEK